MICYDEDACWKRFDGALSGEVDASIATTHMMLEAEDLGLGSVWVMAFNAAVLRKVFELPDNIVPVALLPVGYAAEGAKPADRHFIRHELDKLLF
jgi:nitroreductase